MLDVRVNVYSVLSIFTVMLGNRLDLAHDPFNWLVKSSILSTEKTGLCKNKLLYSESGIATNVVPESKIADCVEIAAVALPILTPLNFNCQNPCLITGDQSIYFI